MTTETLPYCLAMVEDEQQESDVVHVLQGVARPVLGAENVADLPALVASHFGAIESRSTLSNICAGRWPRTEVDAVFMLTTPPTDAVMRRCQVLLWGSLLGVAVLPVTGKLLRDTDVTSVLTAFRMEEVKTLGVVSGRHFKEDPLLPQHIAGLDVIVSVEADASARSALLRSLFV
jgi:hypothetical protein